MTGLFNGIKRGPGYLFGSSFFVEKSHIFFARILPAFFPHRSRTGGTNGVILRYFAGMWKTLEFNGKL